MGVSESSVEDDFPTDEPDSHYLDQEMDTAAAAQNFAISAGSLIPGEVVEISQAASTSASVAATGSTTASATAATVTAPAATAVNPPCGCEKNCLAKFSWEEIQQQQFLMQELEKTEKEMFLMGMLLSKQNMSAETRRGKRKHATSVFLPREGGLPRGIQNNLRRHAASDESNKEALAGKWSGAANAWKHRQAPGKCFGISRCETVR